MPGKKTNGGKKAKPSGAKSSPQTKPAPKNTYKKKNKR